MDVAEESAARTSCALDDDAAFTWGADVKQIEQELLSEGVARMGRVSEAWLQAAEEF